MGFVAILVAAAAAWLFGAAYYMILAKPWMTASGVQPGSGGSALPYAASAVLLVVVAGMMRHVLFMSGIGTPGGGILSGLGLGLFVVSPWITMNNLYGQRPWHLSLIDGGYATLGCGIIGGVLTLL